MSPQTILAAVFVLSALPFLLVELFPSWLYMTMDVAPYLVFHNIAEFFSVMVSLSIFGIGWYSFDQSKDRHALFLSAAFLAIGLMDFMHALGYSGMPTFITPNAANKSTQFWIAVRLFTSAVFLISAYIYSDSQARCLSKLNLLAASSAVSGAVFIGVIYFPSHLPATFVEGSGLTEFKKASEYVIIALLAAASVTYWRRFLRTGERLLLFYIAAFIVCIFSELVFTVYKSVFDTFNVLGHIYKVVGFSIIYRGIFVVSVKRPYVQLQQEVAVRKQVEDRLIEGETKLLRINKALKTLSECNQALVRAKEETLLVDDICRTIKDHGGYRMTLVGFAEHDAAKTVHAVAQAGYEDGFLETVKLTWTDTEAGNEPIATAIRERKISIFNDVTSEKYPVLWREAASKRGYASAIGLPLRINSDILGALAIYSSEKEAFDKEEVKLLAELSEDLSFGISSLRLRKEREKMEIQLREYAGDLEKKVDARTNELKNANLELHTLNKELELRRQEAEEAKIQAEAATRAKSDFLANMSHELRTPLNSVLGFSELLEDRLFGDLNEKQMEYVRDISSSGRHLLDLINDILDLAKVESGKMELDLGRFFLKDVLNASISLLREKAMKHCIKLNLDINPEAEIEIEADKRKLKQIMFNLLSNAVKFTTEGGSVRVTARKGIRGLGSGIGEKELTSNPQTPPPDGDFIEIVVSDTGIGIKTEDLPKLFKQFVQIESVYTRKHEGTGLGLALTKRLVELHRGSIWVESEFGKGSSFTFTIPVKQNLKS